MKSEAVAPVSRCIGVADRNRSLAFYRDVLGFEVLSNDEVVLGPARVVFSDPDSPPRGPAILFFESGDVAALQAAIRARGGETSELEKVNYIKMRVFEIRDPDGHVLWFAQSYHQPDREMPEPLFEKALPELPFENVAAAVEHYRDVLGFKINYQQDNLGVMDRDQVTVLLVEKTNQIKGSGSAYFYVRDADALYAELKGKGGNMLGEPVSYPWGLRDFKVQDLEGNLLRFGQPFE